MTAQAKYAELVVSDAKPGDVCFTLSSRNRGGDRHIEMMRMIISVIPIHRVKADGSIHKFEIVWLRLFETRFWVDSKPMYVTQYHPTAKFTTFKSTCKDVPESGMIIHGGNQSRDGVLEAACETIEETPRSPEQDTPSCRPRTRFFVDEDESEQFDDWCHTISSNPK